MSVTPSVGRYRVVSLQTLSFNGPFFLPPSRLTPTFPSPNLTSKILLTEGKGGIGQSLPTLFLHTRESLTLFDGPFRFLSSTLITPEVEDHDFERVP